MSMSVAQKWLFLAALPWIGWACLCLLPSRLGHLIQLGAIIVCGIILLMACALVWRIDASSVQPQMVDVLTSGLLGLHVSLGLDAA